MSTLFKRSFSQYTRLQYALGPRFTQTLKEASKKPLEKPQPTLRPFGLETPVLLNHKLTNLWTLKGLNAELFSSEAKERRQKQLDHDIVHSPFYESKSFTNTNGKIFTPPVSYFKAEKSMYFPDFVSLTLDQPKQSFYELLENKVNIVRLYSTVSGEKCANTYFEVDGENYLTSGFDKFLKDYPNSQIIDINIPQNWAKELLVNLSKSNIKKTVPNPRHKSFFILPYQTFSFEIKQKLNCDNSCSGYIYLLDSQGRIRWATSGFSNEDESKLMWKCIKGLEKELM